MSDFTYPVDAIHTFLLLCGRLAPIASIFVFFSSLPTILKVKNNKKVGNLPLLPYSSMVSSTYLWTIYGLLRSEPAIWTSNLTGLILGTYYFFTFIKYAPKSSPSLPGSIQQHCQGMAAIIGTCSILPFVMPMISPTYDSADPVGKAGVVLTVVLFASPLAAIKAVIETKSGRAIPLPFTLACVVNCLLWFIFGWFQINDSNVYVPNLLGLLFSILQLLLKLFYSDFVSGKAKEEELSSNEETEALRKDSAV